MNWRSQFISETSIDVVAYRLHIALSGRVPNFLKEETIVVRHFFAVFSPRVNVRWARRPSLWVSR